MAKKKAEAEQVEAGPPPAHSVVESRHKAEAERQAWARSERAKAVAEASGK